MESAYSMLYNIVLVILGILLFFCLFRSIRGPRIADRIVAVNMVGTMVICIICTLALAMGEGYLTDIALIYTMLSFLAVVLLTKVYMGVHREKELKAQKKEEQHNA